MPSLSYRIEALGFKGVGVFAAALGERGRRLVGGLLGRLAGRVLSRLRRTALENVRAAYPDMAEEDVRRLVSANLAHIGFVGLEFLATRARGERFFAESVRIENEELFKEAHSRGKGVLLLGPHLGNWEYAIQPLAVRGYKIAAIGRRIHNPLVDELVNGIRTTYGARIIPHRDAVRPVLRILKGGGAVGFLLDQKPVKSEWVVSEFFGRMVGTNPGLALLALRTGAPVIYAQCIWQDGGYVLKFGPEVEPPDEKDRSRAVELFTRKFDQVIEDHVRQNPEQWFWVHKRWRIHERMAIMLEQRRKADK